MDNFENLNSYPENNWQSLSEPIVKLEEPQPDVQAVPKAKKLPRHPVLTIQLTLCLCALLFLFIVKFMAYPLYSKIITWYESQISRSVIYDGDFESFDFSTLFSTTDEA